MIGYNLVVLSSVINVFCEVRQNMNEELDRKVTDTTDINTNGT